MSYISTTCRIQACMCSSSVANPKHKEKPCFCMFRQTDNFNLTLLKQSHLHRCLLHDPLTLTWTCTHFEPHTHTHTHTHTLTHTHTQVPVWQPGIYIVRQTDNFNPILFKQSHLSRCLALRVRVGAG